jgi:CAAX prenyl protease-like protein
VGIAGGAIGFVVWVAAAGLTQERVLSGLLPPSLLAGQRGAFNPFEAIASPLGRVSFLAVRLTGLVAVVPLMEELFWRGFLARYLISAEFEQVKYGRFTTVSFAVVTLVFAAVHPELVSAILWCAGVNLVLMATRNLWAAITMHAVTNALLGAYILWSQRWELW